MRTHPHWEAGPEDVQRSSDFSICTIEGAGRREWDKQYPYPQHGDEGGKKEKKKKRKRDLAQGWCLSSCE